MSTDKQLRDKDFFGNELVRPRLAEGVPTQPADDADIDGILFWDGDTVATHVDGTKKRLAGEDDIAAGKTYEHVQEVAALSWAIDHNLGFFPNVTVFDATTGERISPTIDYVNINQVTVSHNKPFAGTATLR